MGPFRYDVVSVRCRELCLLEVFVKRDYKNLFNVRREFEKTGAGVRFPCVPLFLSTDWGPEGMEEVNGHQCIQISHFAEKQVPADKCP